MVEGTTSCLVVSPDDHGHLGLSFECSMYICGSHNLESVGWQTKLVDGVRTLPIAIYASGLGKKISFSEFVAWKERVLRTVDGVFCWISKDSDWFDYLELGSILRRNKQVWVGVDFELENFEYVAKVIQEIRSEIYIFADVNMAIEHVFRYFAGELEPTEVIGIGNRMQE